MVFDINTVHGLTVLKITHLSDMEPSFAHSPHSTQCSPASGASSACYESLWLLQGVTTSRTHNSTACHLKS